MTGETRKHRHREIKTVKPGNRVLRIRTRKRRLPIIRRRVSGPAVAAFDLFADIFRQTPVLPIIAFLAVLVVLAPAPIFLIERTADDAEMTTYWIGLWWAVSAFTTVGHSDVSLVTGAGRALGSMYTVVSICLFFGSVIAAFSSVFLLTWRKPKRMLIDSVTYYLQRIDDMSAEEIEDLEEITAGLLRTAKERAETENRRSRDDDEG